MGHSRSSLWRTNTDLPEFPTLVGDVRCDVLVVGAGITGLTTAFELTDRGFDVIVLEANRLLAGTTGGTTAKLTSQHGLIYDQLETRYGRKLAGQYADANAAGIETVASISDGLDVDPTFERRPAYVYAESESDRAAIEREARSARALDLPATVIDDVDAPVDAAVALRFDEQAQFHPGTYVAGLAGALRDRGCQIYERTRATGLDAGDPCRVRTERGQVTADHVVAASLFPFSDRGGYFARMHPSRAYLLTVKLAAPGPTGMYYDKGGSTTFRSCTIDGRDLLIVGGLSHKCHERDPVPAHRYERCEAFAREHFPVESVLHRWSAHDYVTHDRVPYIGSIGPISPNTYVATGFNKWGLTAGTAAGKIVSGLIEAGSHPWAEVFDPMRLGRIGGLRSIKENAMVGRRFVGDWVKGLINTDIPEHGSATVIRRRGRPLAVYRDEDGTCTAVSAVCTHMWCLVEWNDVDRTWDCPCHGSRFDVEGTVLNGPANRPLEEIDLDE